MDIDKVQAEVQKRFDDGVAFLKSVPAELRTNKLWQLTADDFAKNVSIGTVAGIALSLIFFRRGRGLRGLTVGLGMGAGMGVTYERANQRFMALQAMQKQTNRVKPSESDGQDAGKRQ